MFWSPDWNFSSTFQPPSEAPCGLHVIWLMSGASSDHEKFSRAFPENFIMLPVSIGLDVVSVDTD